MSEPKVTNGDAVEVVARVINVSVTDRTRSYLTTRILVALSAHVREHGPLPLGDGVVAMPSEPTDAMVEAAATQLHAESDLDYMGDFSIGQVQLVARLAFRGAAASVVAVREEEG